jgi:TRAP-type C4-dicarboxylate transport system permease small subunit
MEAKDASRPPQPAVYEALRHKAAVDLAQKEDKALHPLWLRTESLLVGSFGVAALLLCSYNVAVRYFHPAWTLELVDEVQVYVIVWAIFLSLGAVTVADRHVKADLFVSFFPEGLRRASEVFIDLLGLAFAGVLVWYGSAAAYQSWSYGDVSTTSLRFPLWIYIAALPAGGLTLSLGYLLRLRQRQQRRN